MKDFQFIIAQSTNLAEALGSVRAMFKQQFPDPGTIQIVNTSFCAILVPGKLAGNVATMFFVTLTIADDKPIVGVEQPTAPPAPLHSVK
jgi:hypothetical protein